MLYAGAAQGIVPWPSDLFMAGYSRRRAASVGTHQPLYARAFIASNKRTEACVCLISIDTLALDAELTQRLRTAIHEKLGIASESILVAATHTHAAPGGIMRFSALPGSEAFLGNYSPPLVDCLVDTVVTLVEQAATSLQPASFATGTAQVDGVASNRRDASGPVDTRIPFLSVFDVSGNLLALIYSFACHPTVLDAENLLYSGDLAGVAASRIAESMNCVVLPLTGAAGDVSTRFTRITSSVTELERLAGIVADSLMAAPTSSTNDDQLCAIHQLITLPLKSAPDPAVLRQKLAQAEERFQAETRLSERRVIEAEIEGLRVALSTGSRPRELETEVQVLRLGPALVVGFPAEMFVQHGLSIIDRLKQAQVLVAGYTNDYIGYVPTSSTVGGYEADVAIVSPGTGITLLQAAETMAHSCLMLDPN